MRAKSAYLLGNDLAKEAAYEETLAMRIPKEREAHQKEATGFRAEALMSYHKASRIQGNCARYLDAEAAMCERMGRDEDGLALRSQAIQMNPFSASMRRSQAETLARLKRYPEALKQADLAIELYPLSPNGYAVKAGILRELNRREEALPLLDKAASLEPYKPENYRDLRKKLEQEIKSK
ncbi:MAG: hypothetical protein NTX50_05120 [Candidatus Sumerlaeota bacterium]|nr:hypothetical protein [Candidatus Sumerlaeota bacterium]